MNLHINSSQFFDAAWKILDAEQVCSIRQIQDASCAYFKVTRLEMMSYRRQRTICIARKVAMYLACEVTQRSLTEIGRMFQRDHTTVMHSRNAIAHERTVNEFFDTAVKEIFAKLEGANQ